MDMWLDLTTTHRQTCLFSSTSTYHLTDFLTARGVAHLVVHGSTEQVARPSRRHDSVRPIVNLWTRTQHVSRLWRRVVSTVDVWWRNDATALRLYIRNDDDDEAYMKYCKGKVRSPYSITEHRVPARALQVWDMQLCQATRSHGPNNDGVHTA